MKIERKEVSSQLCIAANQLIDNHNCMAFNKIHIANIKRFISVDNRKAKYYGLNYEVKQEVRK